MTTDDSSHNMLKAGETCWRLAAAKRAKILIDGASYYGALRAALLKAERSVFIVGWDIDSRTRLVGTSGKVEDGYPESFGSFLTRLVEDRPDMRIHLLLWDYSMLYALEREPLPSINLHWSTPRQISVCLDDVLPVGSSHHQKIVVVDDTLAFCGGLDLTIRRWDSPAHEINDNKRKDPSGASYRPFHDIQMMTDGEAASALAELVRRRWLNAACEKPIELVAEGDLWPDDVEPDFRDIEIGIARTVPAFEGNAEVREIEALFLRSIEAAERAIYIENQFLTAHKVVERLIRRMQENADLEVLIVAPNVHQSWLEQRSMNAGRRRFMAQLEEAGFEERVRLLYPSLPDDLSGQGVMVHAKLMIVDDCLVRVGSANLNNRSMGVDTECDLALEAHTTDERRTIAGIRNKLLGEHLGTAADTVARTIQEEDSLLAAVTKLSEGPRSLKPIDLSNVPEDELTRTVSQLADPERPIATPSFAGDMFGGQSSEQSNTRTLKLVLAAVTIIGLVAAWRYTPLSDFTEPEQIVEWLRHLSGILWTPVLIPVAYVLGSLSLFPITVLIAVTGMMFHPLSAFGYALGGSLLSAAVTYQIGHAIGKGPLRSFAGPRVNRVSRALARRGVLSVAGLRMVPIAPFGVINVVAGASHISFLHFMLGTLVGMAPGIAVMIFLGRQLAHAISDPRPTEILLLGLCIFAWLALAVGLQALSSRLSRGRDAGS